MTPIIFAALIAFICFCGVITARTVSVTAGEKWVLGSRTDTAAEATDARYREPFITAPEVTNEQPA